MGPPKNGIMPNNKKKNQAKQIDLLDEDKPVAGQKFVCVSFISPEKVLKDKHIHHLNEFLKTWDMNKSFEKYKQFTSFISFKYNISMDDICKDLDEFCAQERENLFATSLEDDYKNYLDTNESKLDEKFNKANNFQTSVRGIKVRGCYETQSEAELRCRSLRESDPNHDVYVGPVGMWMPFHPEAYKTGRVEYLEDELNKLMHEKERNETTAKVEFDKRVKESKSKAIEDNMKKAEESGNLLSQTVDEEGNLMNVRDSGMMDEINNIFDQKNVTTNMEKTD